MILPLSVKNQSVESSGITNDYRDAICEYIWNGLEAHATEIYIEFSSNVACGISELSILDNGDGIVYEELEDTFGAFLASKKNLLSLKMKSKANKGKGRFSFVAFASSAKWTTVYKKDEEVKCYEIVLENNKKEVINCTDPVIVEGKKTGTKVEFFNIKNDRVHLEERWKIPNLYVILDAENKETNMNFGGGYLWQNILYVLYRKVIIIEWQRFIIQITRFCFIIWVWILP